MSRANFLSGIGIGLLSLSSLTFGGCGRSSEHAPTLPKIPTPDALVLGSAGDATFYVKEIEGRSFLIADGNESLAMAPLASSNRENGPTTGSDAFSVREVSGDVGDATLYVIEYNGQKFLFGDGNSSGGLVEINR